MWRWANEIDFKYWPLWMKVAYVIAIVAIFFVGSISDINF